LINFEILPGIESPKNLRALTDEQLVQLTDEIREALCGVVSTRSAHFASNLGVVELAIALQGVFAQQERQNALCDEFLDLCTIHGENDPGEPRLAREFLKRIERGEVGTRTEKEQKPW